MKTESPEKFRVKYRRGAKGVCFSNILFPQSWPMRGGKFPPGHPVGGTSLDADGVQMGNCAGMEAFRARGYWASCFPEGDGITFYPELDEDKLAHEVIKDIEECFGWDVTYDRGL